MGLNPLQQFNVVTVVGMIVVFWVTFGALKVGFFNPVLDVIMARREKLDAGKAKLEEAAQVVEAARVEAEAVLSEAGREAEKIEREATEDAESRRQQELATAKAEAERVLADGRKDVVRLRKEEEARVREELVGCTTIACEKLVGKVDGRLVGSIVDKVMRAKLAT